MEFNKLIINVKENQNLVEIEGVGAFRFVPWSKNYPVSCWDCDLHNMGICEVIPCYMGERGDYQDGVFQSFNHQNY